MLKESFSHTMMSRGELGEGEHTTFGFQAQVPTRVDKYQLLNGCEIMKVKIVFHPTTLTDEKSGPIHHDYLPWKTLSVGDKLIVTLVNRASKKARPGIILRGVSIS